MCIINILNIYFFFTRNIQKGAQNIENIIYTIDFKYNRKIIKYKTNITTYITKSNDVIYYSCFYFSCRILITKILTILYDNKY